MPVIGLPDGLHITRRNFNSLYDYASRAGFEFHVAAGNGEWITCFGNYDKKLDVLKPYIDELETKTEQELFDYSLHEINLFKTCRAEILCLVMPQKNWLNKAYPKNLREIFSRLYKYNKSELLQNMAAAKHWILYWRDYLRNKKQPDYWCIFSGSLTYSRTLIETLKYYPGKVFILESFFTGVDYYCEEKYEPIANNSDLKFTSYYNNIETPPFGSKAYEIQRNHAISKVKNIKNKNVKQPKRIGKRLFSNNKPTAFIIGQVLNDFSMLEYKGIGLNSVNIYERIITELLEKTDCNIIFKAHPWENKKANLKTPITKDTLTKRINKLDNSRIRFVEDYPLEDIFAESTYVIAINSQGAIEATFHGFKPMIFGDAFYGNKGFTYDFTPEQISDACEQISSGKIQGNLSLSEFNKLEEFLVKSLQYSLVPESSEGIERLERIFNKTAKLLIKKQNTTAKVTAPIPIQKTKRTKAAKLRKLFRNPHQFFDDSKLKLIRPFRHLF